MCIIKLYYTLNIKSIKIISNIKQTFRNNSIKNQFSSTISINDNSFNSSFYIFKISTHINFLFFFFRYLIRSNRFFVSNMMTLRWQSVITLTPPWRSKAIGDVVVSSFLEWLLADIFIARSPCIYTLVLLYRERKYF